jgi:hypothetical protein
MPDSNHERRRWERRPFHAAARLVRGDGTAVAGSIQNLGEGGAFFATDDLESALGEGDDVTLMIERGSRGTLAVSGQILRIDLDFVEAEVQRSLAIRFHETLPEEVFSPEGSRGDPQ